MAAAEPVPNSCAGPFGAFYDFYIERPRLVSVIGRAVWGIDSSSPLREHGADLPGSARRDDRRRAMRRRRRPCAP